jgi:cellobiose-specific phosphotransferase system component IIA
MAIEQAAAEAAKAATLASLDREGAAIAQARSSLAEAHHWREAYGEERTRGIKRAVITGLVCFFSGLAVGGLITRLLAGY